MSVRKAPGYTGLIVLALFLCAAFLGADLEMFDSINIAAPLWLAAVCLYLIRVMWIGWRSRRKEHVVAAIVLIAAYAALGALLFRPLWASPAAGDAGANNFTLVSFNLNKDNLNAEAVVRWIGAQSADFVILLEARERAGTVPALLKARYPYQYDCRGDGLCSTLILSRSPARAITHHAHGDTENRRSISALTVHFDRAGKDLAITAAHLPRPWPLGRQAVRLRELAAVAVSGTGGHILVGDFNNVPWTFAMNRLAADMNVRLLTRGIPTWPSAKHVPFLPIDNLYGSECIKPVGTARGPALGSDHYPLVVTAWLGPCDA